MGTCATCGNEYDGSFTVSMQGQSLEFDSFECAIEKLAPRCAHCECRIIGHGVQSGSTMYCCAHCAEKSGDKDLKDRQ